MPFSLIDPLFEACVESLQEAREASTWGADRVELCIDLAHDGCTPPLSLVEECLTTVDIPVIAMVRPRAGTFTYSRVELGGMCDAIRDLAARGVAGFATGALRLDGRIDLSATERFVAAAGALPVTFHRAFDAVDDLDGALEALIHAGVRRVLTSGGAEAAMAGLDALRRLVDRAAARIEVVAAGGIRPFNVDRVVAETHAPAVHARWIGWRDA